MITEAMAKEKKIKCRKCGQEMKKSGPYSHCKDEGESAYKGPHTVYYCCMNEKCENFYKTIKIMEE